MAGISTGYAGLAAVGFVVLWVLASATVVFLRYAGHRDGVRLRHLARLVLNPWRLVSDRRRAMALQAAAVAAYDDEVGAYRVTAAAWHRRRSELSTLLRIAEEPVGADTVYCTVPASLLVNNADPQPGKLIVGAQRIVFEGDVRREWDCRSVEEVRDVGGDRTLLRAAGEEAWTGLRYAEDPVARHYLELALATSPQSRASFLKSVRRGLENIELGDPQRPEPPMPAPGLPRRQRARAERWRRERLAELALMKSLNAEWAVPAPRATNGPAFVTAA